MESTKGATRSLLLNQTEDERGGETWESPYAYLVTRFFPSVDGRVGAEIGEGVFSGKIFCGTHSDCVRNDHTGKLNVNIRCPIHRSAVVAAELHSKLLVTAVKSDGVIVVVVVVTAAATGFYRACYRFGTILAGTSVVPAAAPTLTTACIRLGAGDQGVATVDRPNLELFNHEHRGL